MPHQPRTLLMLGLAALAAVSACSSSTSDEPLAFGRGIADTEQALRIRVERVGSTVEIRAVADCRDGAPSHVEQEVLRADVSASGEFAATHEAVHDWPDGDEGHLTATVEGRLRGDEAEGTIEVRVRYWNGQGQAFDERECVTGPVRWRVRSGAWDWPDIEAIPVEGVRSVETGDDHAYAFGPWYLPDRPVGVTTIDRAGTVLGRVDLTVEDFSFADHVGALSVHDGHLWGLTRSGPFDGAIGRHDLRSGQASTLPVNVSGLLADGRHLWTLSYVAGADPVHTLERRDPATGEVLAGATAIAGRLAHAGDRVWIVDDIAHRATAHDPQSLERAETLELPEVSVRQVHGTPTALWLLGEGTVLRVDLPTGHVDRWSVEASDMAVADGRAWIVQPRQRTVRVLDRTGIVRTYDLPVSGTSVAVGDGPTAWIAAPDGGTVVRLEP